MNDAPDFAEVERAIVTVGDGRGFVTEVRGPFHHPNRCVVTAAHCLPHLPPAHLASYTAERTFANLVGPISRKPNVWVECRFVDPVGDTAVLVEPDGQELDEESQAYLEFVDAAATLPIQPPTLGRPAWLLDLDGVWFPAAFTFRTGGSLFIGAESRRILGGMSGSPIVQDGAAVGVVSTANSAHSFSPCLVHALPGWILNPVEGAPRPRVNWPKVDAMTDEEIEANSAPELKNLPANFWDGGESGTT